MTQIKTIHARTSDRAINKVTRLFNASISTILQELLQNSRRSGATQISLSTQVENNQQWLCISDDGSGIANPQILLTLGDSNWNSPTITNEDPAGMGFFSLAQRGGRICSGDWLVELTSQHFTGEESAPVREVPYLEGTTISFPLKADETKRLKSLIDEVVKYYPLPVVFNGEALIQRDFLADCLYRESWRGLDFGVCRGYMSPYSPRLNFFGITLAENLPSVSQVISNAPDLSLRIDVKDCPELKLVLPARKELVQDDFLQEVRQQGLRVLYRYLATCDEHRLPYPRWQEAQELGIELPEATAQLYLFYPACSDEYHEDDFCKTLVDIGDDALIVNFDDLGANDEQLFWRGFSQENLGYTAVKSEPYFEGYSWYDSLPVVSDYGVMFTVDGEQFTRSQFEESFGYFQVKKVDEIAISASLKTRDNFADLSANSSDEESDNFTDLSSNSSDDNSDNVTEISSSTSVENSDEHAEISSNISLDKTDSTTEIYSRTSVENSDNFTEISSNNSDESSDEHAESSAQISEVTSDSVTEIYSQTSDKQSEQLDDATDTSEENSDSITEISFTTDIFFLVDNCFWVDMEEVPICLTKDATITPDELMWLWRDCFFCPADEYDTDSYETQRDNFELRASKYALELLISKKEAVAEQIRLIMEREMVRWLLPDNWRVDVTISRHGYDVEVTEG